MFGPFGIRHWWRHLHWFDVWRARDWQTVICCGLVCVFLLAALGIASLY